MKITCEHCGSTIDVDNENKCSNCGAPYSDNKEYKRRKEIKDREDEARLNSRELKNKITEGTINTVKHFKYIKIIIIIIVLFVFGLIAIVGYISYKETRNVFDNNYNKSTNSSSYNNELELFKGTQNGFFTSRLLDIIININSQNRDYKISVIYNDKYYNSREEILDLKDKIIDQNKYNILYNYDSDNYITSVNILEQ